MNYSRRPFVTTLLVLCLAAPLLWLNRSAEAQSPPPVDLSDDFNDNSLDSTKWNINAPGSPAVVSEQGQVIQIALPPSTATYNGISSKTTHDMRDKTMEVEVVQAPSHAGWVEHSIQVALDGQNYYLVGAGSGSIVFRSVVAGAQDQTVLNYDPVAFRFWGIRHDQASNKISLQTSPDGVTWTTRKRMTAGFSLSAVYFYVYAGAWGTGNSNPGVAKYDNFQVVPSNSRGVNVAHSLNGAFATASSTYSLSYQASSAINGDRKGVNWGANGGWHDVAPNNSFPDWLQVDFESSKTINEVDVFSVQDNYANPAEPTETMTFSLYGLTGYEVQYWNGTAWQNIPGASVTGNNLVWRRFNFTPVTTSKIRVLTNASVDGYSRIIEVEAYTPVVHPLAAQWKFDEGSGTTVSDSSGNGSTGNVVGATWTTGQVGTGAMNFNGTSNVVDIVSSPALSNVSNNFTLSFWANPRSTHQIDPETTSGFGGTSGQRYVVGPKWYGNGDAGAGISVGTNGISVYEHAANYMPATLVYQATLSGWTHIVLVYKNKQPKLYVNGVLVRTGLTSPMNSVHIPPVHLGGMGYGYFDGMVDEMSVYKDSFTLTDVQAMYSYQATYKGGMMSMESAVSAPSSSIQFFKSVKGTDVANFGVGGIRNNGQGAITVSGMPGTIREAYLYWHGSNFNTELNLGGALTLTWFVNNVPTSVAVQGTFIGRSADNFWLFPGSFSIYPNTVAWRANVTSLVNQNGPNKTYFLTAFNSFPSFNPNGASLIILYNDATSSNDLDVSIYDGNDGNSHSNFDSDGWFAQLANFEYASGTATLDMHVADGQVELNDPDVKLNNQAWLTGNWFKGINVSALWDILNFNVTSFVQPGNNSLTITSPPAPPPPFVLDGLNLIVAVVRVPAVREVKNVTWEVIDSTLDQNPNAGGGFRMFPDQQFLGDTTNRRRVRVRAETTMGSGQTVFFKSFDIDEPGTDAMPIDTNGTAAGDDNRGTPKAGTLNLTQATTDSNGIATVEFTTTMNPGDNFMVAASKDQNYLNGVIATGQGLRDSSGNNLPTIKAKATAMLTVWRRVHIEVDSMGLVSGNFEVGDIRYIEPNHIIGCQPKPCSPDTTIHLVGIEPSLFDETRFRDGSARMIISGVSYQVRDIFFGDIVEIATPDGNTPIGTTFTLIDDDDYNENDPISTPDGDDFEDIDVLDETFSAMQPNDNPTENVFAAAYIRPVYDGGGSALNNETNIPFRLNIADNSPAEEDTINFGQDSASDANDAFWIVYVQLTYQGDLIFDNDPDSEQAQGGVTLTFGSANDASATVPVPRGGNSSLIYLEANTDHARDFVNDWRKRTAPHEVGHQFGLKGHDETVTEFGIMNNGGPLTFGPRHLNMLRWRVKSPGRP